MRPESRKRQQARHHLEATLGAAAEHLHGYGVEWSHYRMIEQLIDAAQQHLQATAPRRRGPGRRVVVEWCKACDGPAPGLDCPACAARIARRAP